jgi:hypothetical protein
VEVPVQWDELHRSITGRASAALARRRWKSRGIRFGIPALAASLALFLLLPDTSPTALIDDRNGGGMASALDPAPVDELLDADISDVQFKALLFGASEADDLLLIAAGEQ